MKENRNFTSVLFFFLVFLSVLVAPDALNANPWLKSINANSDTIHTDTIKNGKDANMVAEPATERKPSRQLTPDEPFKEIVLRIDNQNYFYLQNNYQWQGQSYLFFRVNELYPVAELRIIPSSVQAFSSIRLIPSADFEILDSLVLVGNEYFRTRIRFHDLSQMVFPSIILGFTHGSGLTFNKEVKLFPYFISRLDYGGEVIDLFQGEEKTIDLPGQNIFNISVENEWQSINGLDYRLQRSGSVLRLSVRASQTGRRILPLNLITQKPFIDTNGDMQQQLPELRVNFDVKPSRLQFINADKEFVFHEPDQRRGEEIRLDYHSGFQLKRTYRIEDQQEAGGVLMAEIYVKSYLSDNKVLAEVKTYALHRVTDGYLYIKDGNRTLFITNFNIVNRPEITQIDILRDGAEWTSNTGVFPGEKVEVRVQGTGLLDVDIQFEGCRQRLDSLRMSDKVLFYEVTIPVNIPRRKITLFMNRNTTRHELLVREYQRPAPLDFVKINYGERDYRITEPKFNKPVFYDQTIRDINLIFDADKIDSDSRLNGKQYLSIEIRILDAQNRLLDVQTIQNIVICPGANSPRYNFYGGSDCSQSNIINLNEHLLRKTYLLDAFSQIIITVKHNDTRYSQPVHSKKITIFVERKSSFDIQVSFPAGLLVKEFKQPGIGNLSGISTSILAELSFYDPKRIGSKRPYKVGAGFIALNAFNFRESADIKRDIGLVVMGSAEPVRRDSKFSVPIYLGFGYLLKEGDLFFIFGPGIRISF